MANENEQDQEQESPALKNFNKPLEYVRHMLKTGFGMALKGALIGVAVAVAFSMFAGGASLAGIPFIGPFLAPLGASLGLQAAAGTTILGFEIPSIIGTWALAGAAVGGAVGVGTGLLNADEVVEEKKEQVLLRAEKQATRKAREKLLAQQSDLHGHVQPAVNLGEMPLTSGLGARTGLQRGEGGPGLGG